MEEKWTKEKCYEVAKECSTRGEYKKKYPSAYAKSIRKKWINDYMWFAPPIQDIYKNKIDTVYLYIFPDNVVYIGRTIKLSTRHWEHSTLFNKDVVAKYAKKNNLPVPEPIVLEKELTLTDGLEREEYWVEYYKEQGYKLLNTKSCGTNSGSLGSLGRGKWSKHKTYEEAKKYKSKNEFRKSCDSAYQAAYRHGWLKDYTWFEKPPVYNKIWTKEKCLEAAKQCKTMKEFRENFITAHDVSKKNGWFNEYTWLKRAIKPNNYWNYETCIEKAKKCNSRTEFQKEYSQGYRIALDNGWLDEYIWFKEKKGVA